jgi:recombinational DNA repair ATPase RecF
MPDTLDAAQYKLPLNALVEAIQSVEAGSDWSKLPAAHDKALAALRSRREELDTLYERAIAPDTNWDEIAQVASMIGAWRDAAAEKLYPQIDDLQRKLCAPHGEISREARQALQQSIEVAEAWLALYRELQNKLLKLAAKRRPADAVLRAHPVEGDIDHDALTREVIARFPKILAALAE